MKKQLAATFIAILSLCYSLTAQNELVGVITTTNKNLYTIQVEKTNLLPGKNDTCSVSKDISGTKNPFGITIQSGWLGVADAVLLSSKGNELTFKIIKETSEIIVNGKKQNHFVKGKKLKISWK
ncbi:MAG: hypothetical protein JNM96_07990 [Bacteroidia bacterium]|nr:hypothetical protein [Bacteroidia bacterium]